MKQKTINSVENVQDGSELFFLNFKTAWDYYQSLLRQNIPARFKEDKKIIFECSHEDIFGFFL